MSALSFSTDAAANPHQLLVGLKINDEASRVQLSSLRAAGITVRVVEPGAMMTKDYNNNRVNISVSAAGTITGVRMG
jgi:hypothetical protein